MSIINPDVLHHICIHMPILDINATLKFFHIIHLDTVFNVEQAVFIYLFPKSPPHNSYTNEVGNFAFSLGLVEEGRTYLIFQRIHLMQTRNERTCRSYHENDLFNLNVVLAQNHRVNCIDLSRYRMDLKPIIRKFMFRQNDTTQVWQYLKNSERMCFYIHRTDCKHENRKCGK